MFEEKRNDRSNVLKGWIDKEAGIVRVGLRVVALFILGHLDFTSNGISISCTDMQPCDEFPHDGFSCAVLHLQPGKAAPEAVGAPCSLSLGAVIHILVLGYLLLLPCN